MEKVFYSAEAEAYRVARVAEIEAASKAAHEELAKDMALLSLCPGPLIQTITRNDWEPHDIKMHIGLRFKTETQTEAVTILRHFEEGGWRRATSACLAAWAKYAHKLVPYSVEDAKLVPHYGSGKFQPPDLWRDGKPAYPIEIYLNKHAKPDLRCHVLAPDGSRHVISIEAPWLPASVSADETGGGSNWNHYNQKLYYPKKWTHVHPLSCARTWVKQDLEGHIYFNESSMLLSEFVGTLNS